MCLVITNSPFAAGIKIPFCKESVWKNGIMILRLSFGNFRRSTPCMDKKQVGKILQGKGKRDYILSFPGVTRGVGQPVE
jgi:hypothetical protein